MNDSHSDKRLLYAAIQEHFPYELDILEHAFAFLHNPESSRRAIRATCSKMQ